MGTGINITGLSLAAGSISGDPFSPDASGKFVRGEVVQRATAALPASTTAPFFNINGGRVKILQILGEITTVIQAQACTLKIQANPTAAGASVDLCATLDVNAAAAQTLLGITGTVANAMVTAVALAAQVTPLIVPVGTLDLVTSATNTGSVKWTMHYVPVDVGATVTAA